MKTHCSSFVRRAVGAIFHSMDPRAWKPPIGGGSKGCVKNIIPNAVTVGAVLAATFAFASAASAQAHTRWQVADVVGGDTKPFAIGHRGFGINLGEDPERPIENTVEAVRDGFRANVFMVEVDVQLTQDGHAVVFHDDVLPDGTCINTLNLGELRRVAPEVPTLRRVLQTARPFTHRHDGPLGLVDIEIKAPSPQCDPDDVFDSMLVAAVMSDVEQTDMAEQVLIESFSPAVVAMAAASAPDIARVLSVSVLQFLTPAQIEAATGWEVTLIDKDAGFGLQWADIGGLFRLPGYVSIDQFVGVALTMGSTAVALDIQVLQQAELSAPGSGSLLVGVLQSFGLSVWSFTVVDEAGWIFLDALGIDGIFIDDVPLGVALQGPAAESAATPQGIALMSNHPNPFNPETQINYQLPEAGTVTLVVYNVMGQKIRVLEQTFRQSGVHQVSWNGRDDAGQSVASGVYLYQLTSGAFSQTRRMLLLK